MNNNSLKLYYNISNIFRSLCLTSFASNILRRRNALTTCCQGFSKKEVQGKYSGQGKKSKGSGKLNFSATATFACFQQAIRAKFGESDQSKALKSKIGTWLSHFADREGGRKYRHVSDNAA